MGAAALGLIGAGIGLNAIGEQQGLKAQAGVENAERGRQAGFNAQLGQQTQALLAGQGAGARSADLNARAAAIAAPQADAARTIAAAAGRVAAGNPQAPQGQVSAADAGAGQQGVDRAALLSLLQAVPQQQQDERMRERGIGVNRAGIVQAAQRSASTLPLQLQAAGFQGQNLRQIAQLLMLGGQAGFSAGMIPSSAGAGANGPIAPTSGAAARLGQAPVGGWATSYPGVA